MARMDPTRMNLIRIKNTTKLAEKGHDLLKRKREVLVMEFLKMLKEAGGDRDRLQEMLQDAYKTTSMGSIYVGDFRLEQASQYVPESGGVEIRINNIMGVKIPEIESKGGFQSNYTALQESLAISDVGDAFDDVKDTVIDIAKREQGLKRLMLEIEKVKRRVNALEYIVIPNLTAEANYITFRLGEMERDTFSGLKHIKKRLEREQAQGE